MANETNIPAVLNDEHGSEQRVNAEAPAEAGEHTKASAKKDTDSNNWKQLLLAAFGPV